ncbi:PHP domain-like protein [Rhizophagus irregularis]|uniref:PHP domain-like protein n=1 Tax=Rhizophagus irregularis TaxID=588596 RepID=A0A2N0S5W2_9GLOM|nr:PHP domain-like protein [Rhizophagus irregularis]PKC70940.1 PHP domain-like protein [Rhizophagus irregularis]
MDQEENALLSRPTQNYNTLNSSEIDISPETPLLPTTSSPPQNQRHRLNGGTGPVLSEIKIPLKIRLYLRDVLLRFSQFILILVFLFTFLTIFKYKAIPDSNDYSDIEFNWRFDPRSYMTPIDNDFGEFNVLLDGHLHTKFSDGRMNPEQLLKWAIANGYNAIIVSDHNNIEGALEAQRIAREKYNDSITVIPAMEYSSCRLHMQFIGINETVDVSPDFPSDERLEEIIDHVHKLGGLVSVNHIPWSNSTEWGYQVGTLPEHPSREKLRDMGVDGFEVINGDTFDWQTYLFVQQNNMLMLTGSDVHFPSTGAYAWTVLNVPNITYEGIMTELRAKRTSFLFDATGTRPRVYPKKNPAYYNLLPMTLLANYWTSFYSESKGMYSFQSTFCHQRKFVMHWESYFWFSLWCLIFFTCYEIGRILLIKGYEYFSIWKLKIGNRRRNENEEERQVDLVDI